MPVSENMASRVGEDLVHLVKAFGALRHHLPRLHPEVETTAYPVIFTLANGPLRVSVIAEKTHSDVSTVSRQVSHLVQVGVLEKVADPTDGRVQNIVLAPAGKELLEDIHQSRGRMFASLMTDWSESEAREFDDYLRRLHCGLTANFDAARVAADTQNFVTTTTNTRKESM